MLKELDAAHCFDYKSPTAIEEIRQTALDTNPEIRYAFDAVGSHKGKETSATLLARCVFPKPVWYMLSCSRICSSGCRLRRRIVQWLSSPNVFLTRLRFQLVLIERVWEACQWAVEKYNVSFCLPQVDVFEGTAEEALDELKALADHGRRFGKLMLENPLSQIQLPA